MYWWHQAAKLVWNAKARASGLITTNSITQTFNARVVEAAVAENRASIVFAVPDHPWVDSESGAAVRIAMTVLQPGESDGRTDSVVREAESADGSFDVAFVTRIGRIDSTLSIGSARSEARPLLANSLLSAQGVLVLGEGFLLTRAERDSLLSEEPTAARYVHPILNGRDLMQRPRGLYVVDLHGVTIEELKAMPALYQRLREKVFPQREQMRDKARRERWWLFGRSNREMRAALAGLPKYIATCRTARHRVFVRLDGDVVPDTKLVVIAHDSPFVLGVLSSRAHVTFASEVGGWLGVGNDATYNHSLCFGAFPFPDASESAKQRIGDIASRIDEHRKRQLGLHESLGLTALYNGLEKLRAGTDPNEKDRAVHEDGLLLVLRELHDELDAAVFDAYGWPQGISDDQVLERLIALNKERAAEEAQGLVRWLRPDYQAPQKRADGVQQFIEGQERDDDSAAPAGRTKLPAWPKSFFDRATAVRDIVLGTTELEEHTALSIAARFARAKPADVEPILDSFAALGQLVVIANGHRRYRRPARFAA